MYRQQQQQRQQIDPRTQQYIQQFGQSKDPAAAAAQARLDPQNYNNVPMRNAEHYHSAQTAPLPFALAAGPYLAGKYGQMYQPGPMGEPVRDPSAGRPQDPYGEMKYGILPLLQLLMGRR